MKYTQQILARKKAALESEEIVDQEVINNQPVEEVEEVVPEEPGNTEDPAAENPEETPAEDPAEGDVPLDGAAEEPELPAEEPEASEEVSEEITPPGAEDPGVAPTTDNGEVTVDQVEAIAGGDQPEAVEEVVEADNAAGEPTTPEEVVEEVEEVNEALGEDPTENDLPSEPGLPSDGVVEDGAVEPVEPSVPGEEPPAEDTGADPSTDPNPEGETVEDETPNGGSEEPTGEVLETSINSDAGISDEAEPGEAPVEAPAPEEAPATSETAPSSEDCACEEGDLGEEDIIEGEDLSFVPFQDEPENEMQGEVLEEALDTYPQVVEVLSDAMDNGGISNEAMALINIFTKRDGIPVDANVALESYNHTARAQTRLALESINEDLKQWLVQFIEWLKDKGQKLVAFFEQQIDRVARYEKAAEHYAGLDDITVVEGEVSGEFLKSVKVDGEIGSNWDNKFSDSVSALVGYLTILNHGAVDIATQSFNDLRSKVLDKLINSSEADSNAGFDEVKGSVDQKVVALLGRVGLSKEGNGPALVGDNHLDVTSPDNESGNWSIPRFSISRDDSTTPESTAALSPAAVRAVAKDVLRLLAAVKDANSKVGEYKALSEKLTSELQRLTKLNEGSGEERARDLRGEIQTTRRIVTGLEALASSAVSASLNLALSASAGALGYVKASVAGAKSAEQPAEAV